MVLVLRQLRTLQEGIGREMAVQGMLQGQRARGGLWKSRNGLPTKVVPTQSQGGGLEVNRQESGAGVPMQWPWETAWLEVEQREVGQR